MIREAVVPRLRALQPAAVADTLRQSLFAIPGLCLVLGGALAELMVRLDRDDVGSWLPDNYETSAENARGVLGAIATGTITVVTLVLTLTLVAIQLASGQLSPRTIVNFLGDRFQQVTVGVVLGTATYSVLALRSVRVAGEGEIAHPPDLTVLTAVALTVASLVMLVISVDRTASRLAVGALVNDVATETCRLVERKYGSDTDQLAAESPGTLVASPPEDDWEATDAVSTDRAGWIQYIDEGALVEGLPQGSQARLLHPVGTFVLSNMELVQIRTDAMDDERAKKVRAAIVIGDRRTMQQDVSFGLTRLTDIGLRALSPGINDPNTAREVALRIGQVVLALQAHEIPAGVREIEGRRIIRVSEPSHDDFVREAFSQLRRAAASDVATLRTIGRTLAVIVAETERRGLPGSLDEVRRQIELVEQALAKLPDHEGEEAQTIMP